MGTKRTPIRRDVRIRITAEAVALYERILELEPTRAACNRGICNAPTISVHCDLCNEHHAKSRQLRRLLGVKLWETSPTDVTPEDPPPPADSARLYDHSIGRALELRAAIEAEIADRGGR
jgi:hypothetical protein